MVICKANNNKMLSAPSKTPHALKHKAHSNHYRRIFNAPRLKPPAATRHTAFPTTRFPVPTATELPVLLVIIL